MLINEVASGIIDISNISEMKWKIGHNCIESNAPYEMFPNEETIFVMENDCNSAMSSQLWDTAVRGK